MGTSVSFGKYSPIALKESEDFDITFSLGQDKSIVPLGILDFDNNYENPYFSFKYSLSGAKIDMLNLQIIDENGDALYDMSYLKPIIITAAKKPFILTEAKKEVPKFDPENPVKSWDYESVFKKHLLSDPDYTQPGSYIIHWDGFDSSDIYDSKKFDNKKYKAKITAIKNGKQKRIEIPFSTQYEKVKWVDVKIDRKAKKIDVALRVNLKDGGAQAFELEKYKDSFDDPRLPAFRTRYPWEKIPEQALIKAKRKPAFKSRSRTYEQLKQLAIEGLGYHWGRNEKHAVACGVMIAGESYQVFMNAVNLDDDDKAIDDISLIYNTNASWMRSGNPGTIEGPISAIGNLFSREAICYNVGYILYSDGWGYSSESHEDSNYKDTSAHEIGHTILKAYGGTIYSYGHKDSVNFATQRQKDSAPQYPMSGEIDIMPYYKDNSLGGESKQPDYFKRRAAAEKDVLGILWLTKLTIG